MNAITINGLSGRTGGQLLLLRISNPGWAYAIDQELDRRARRCTEKPTVSLLSQMVREVMSIKTADVSTWPRRLKTSA